MTDGNLEPSLLARLLALSDMEMDSINIVSQLLMFRSVCKIMSVCPHATTRLPLDGFS
jgi:hypothetical protein